MAKKAYDAGKPKCYVTHKPLHFGEGVLYGGNCSTPILKDLDAYVALESLNMSNDRRQYPWNKGNAFTFRIPNGGIPEEPVEFVRLVDWIAHQLERARQIHVGCIGGHGRTGMVLAAVAQMMGKAPHGTDYVREHYCEKAVETAVQVDFLEDVYGITPVLPYYQIKAGKTGK